MGTSNGYVEPVCWTHFYGEIGEAEFDAYLAHHIEQVQLAHDEGRRIIGLVLHRNVTAPTAKQRQKAAAAIEEYGPLMAEHLPQYDYVFDSAVARGTVTAIGWLVRKSFVERVHKTPESALLAMAREFPDVEPAKVWASIESAVPADERFPWSGDA